MLRSQNRNPARLATLRALVLRRVLSLLMIAATSVWAGLAGAADRAPCEDEVPCQLDDGAYYLATPEDWDGESTLPVIMFFHGHRSSGRSVMRGGVRRIFGEAGYAVIAPNGPTRPGADYNFWPARPQDAPIRDDIAFVKAVVDDAASRLPLDRARILVGGFSAGGSMAWMIACNEGSLFAGYVSVAGALRRPAPEETCPGGPVRMLHIHGFADKQVPLEGRGIRDWHQGDVFESLSLLRRTNQCRSNPNAINIGEKFSCRSWTDCKAGGEIRFCMHDGGHGLPRGWVQNARDWFERSPSE